MIKTIFAMLAAVSLGTPAFADNSKITKGYNSMDAMGCMLLRECTDGVDKIESIASIADQYPNTNFDIVADEFNSISSLLSRSELGCF